MKKNKYYEKLKDPRWQKVRLQVFERDEWACVVCGNKTKPLNVHHVAYFQGMEPWEVPRGFLVTLCESCHKKPDNAFRLRRDISNVLDMMWKIRGGFVSVRTALKRKLQDESKKS